MDLVRFQGDRMKALTNDDFYMTTLPQTGLCSRALFVPVPHAGAGVWWCTSKAVTLAFSIGAPSLCVSISVLLKVQCVVFSGIY